ncbi:MAG: hypothetical protein KIT33_15980 [Candidatus Kapabacteria bacterium]|nr:hypothetical protein [Ignavibacteriota bacterium]MCW5886471.1 hypothetical protein [Candidatus Kapabacteria bacterium]
MDIVIGILLLFGMPALIIYGIIKLIKKSNKKVNPVNIKANENISNISNDDTVKEDVLTSQIKEALKESIEITIRTTTNSNFEIINDNTFGELTGDSINGWVVNSGASFSITVLHPEKNIALSVKEILENKSIYFGEKRRKLIHLFAAKNIKIKEIEDYKRKYKALYLENIEKEVMLSREWELLGERDRDDLFKEFKMRAVQQLHIRPDCNLDILFNYEPNDITLDDDLIEDYGFETIDFYLWNCDKMDKIFVAESGTDYRTSFENLVSNGLAIKGEDIPLEEILINLTLKQLNSIAQNTDKEYKRKAQAVDFILNNNKAMERINRFVSFRELFKIKPLPEKYSDIDLSVISMTWQYHKEEAELVINTFNTCVNHFNSIQDLNNVKSFNLFNSSNNNNCPCCESEGEREYPVKHIPILPHHIGCNCWIRANYDYEKMRNDIFN